MGIEDVVNFYLGHEDYHPGKPHPACYLRAAEIAEALPENCVVFEDSNAGISAAKDAGMYGVALGAFGTSRAGLQLCRPGAG